MFLPGQFSRRAEFYQQLAQLTSAGIGVIPALQHLQRSPPAQSYRPRIARLTEELNAGLTLGEALERVPWLPDFDLALLRAGEHSGRLDHCLRLLASHYDDRARLSRQVLADLLYPIALFHLAVFILPFARFFLSGDVVAYARSTLGVLVPLYALAAFVIFALQSRHGESWRAVIETLLRPVPVLGKARYHLALGRLAAALESLLAAGVSIVEAWPMAAGASGSPALKRTVRGWRQKLESGSTPAELVNASGAFPSLFASEYASGEISGGLEDSLQRLHRYYQEEGSRKLHAFAQWVPRLVYLAVALMIGWRVVGFYLGYFRQIGEAINFFE